MQSKESIEAKKKESELLRVRIQKETLRYVFTTIFVGPFEYGLKTHIAKIY